jgi:hypothetical protein
MFRVYKFMLHKIYINYPIIIDSNSDNIITVIKNYLTICLLVLLLILLFVVVDQKLITANDTIREPGTCIVLKHSPVDQFHNFIV